MTEFLDFGRMPLGDGFLSPEEFPSEYFFHLIAAVCQSCGMVQTVHDVDRTRMFHGAYAFVTSSSSRMVRHFRELARGVIAGLKSLDPFIVEIGCNDGSMLEEFARQGVRHLGVEPAANVAEMARARGLRVVCEFFEEETALGIRENEGLADAIIATNCMCHLPYMNSVLRGVKALLKLDGVLIFEDPYLGDILERGAFDQFYDEHTFYFSVGAVQSMLRAHDLELVDVEPQPVHGGSMRYFVAHAGARPVSPHVHETAVAENTLGVRDVSIYDSLRIRAERARAELPALLAELQAKGKRTVGYAATAKSATLLNYCGITAELVPCVYDTTPGKQGLFTPGSHLPVRAYEEFSREYPDYALLFAWNHAAEIFEKEQAFAKAGGRWILYVPELRVLEGYPPT